MSWSEAKWVVDQLLQKTGQSPNNMRAFTAFAMSKTSIGLKFLEPADSYDSAGNLVCSVGGVMIRKSTNGFPASVSDGELVIDNTSLGAYENTPFEVTGLTAGQVYYFAAFPYSAQGVFNLSSSGKNRAEGVPADGEQAVVSITIDDSSGFTSTVVTCVDETDSSTSQSVTLTPSKTTHTFTIPIGHRYHIEYGSVTDYFKPNNTDSKVSVAGATSEYTGAYSYFTSTISVTYPTGSTLTCTNGDVSYTAPTTTGSYQFKVHRAGTWTVKATNGSEIAESPVVISDTGESKSITLAYFTATIGVTYPAGAKLTCSCNGRVYEADTTSGSYTFTVHATGTWTVKAELGDETAQTTVSITSDGQSENVTLAFFRSTISVTYPAGATLTCTSGGETLTATSTTGKYSFEIRKAGTWVVKAELNDESAEESVSITASGQTKNVTLAFYRSTIAVTYPAGATCTCSYNGEVLTAPNTSGSYTFTVNKSGTWKIKAVDGSLTSETNVSITASGQSKTATLTFFTATIKVTYPAGATCTCTKGSTTLTASGTSGSYTFTVHETGTYTLKATLNGETTQGTANITADGQNVNVSLAFVKIYGISRTVGNSSTVWARTDDSVGKTATASVGTSAGHSDFDSCYPWSAMKRETLSTGDVMVKIPEFWFERKVTNGVETIRIADKAVTGFVKHPGSGKYVGAYKTSSNNKSVKGAAPTVSQTRATMRTNAKSKGNGWGLIDVATNSAIQMLYLVEFADNDSQKTLGRGYCDGNSSALSSGSCDSVPNLTGRPSGTDGKVDVVYRGIEGIQGNIWEWMDGLNYNGDTDNYYVCTDPTKYADDTATGYTKVSFTSPTSNAYITKEGMDTALPWAMLPSEATNGSETTHYPDYFYQNSGWRVAGRSGNWNYGSGCGVWSLGCGGTSSATSTDVGSRLLYDPS